VNGFLLDTNVVSDLRKPRPNGGLVDWIASTDEHMLYISVLTIGELRIGITLQTDAKKRAALETWLISGLIGRFAGRILAFDLDVAQQWGRIEGRARLGAGRLPVVDSQLAATALYHGLTLVTNNEADFSRSGASILNPWT
jgi:predicted nucleic acid-binding protein